MLAFWIIAIVWVINMLISYWNARVTGLVWVETKQMGGFPRFMTWMGAIMSASGFTWCYLIVLLFGSFYGQHLFLKPDDNGIVHLWITERILNGGFALGYVVLVPAFLFAGFFIWIESLVQAWRRRDLPSMGIAAWNTFAQIHNTYGAMQGMPEAFKAVKELFKGDNKNGVVLVIFLVILAVISGVLTTWGIVNKYAGTRPLPVRPRASEGESYDAVPAYASYSRRGR